MSPRISCENCGDYPCTCHQRKLTKEELLDFQLTEDDFESTIHGVLIKFNSHIIKKILHDQALANELKSTHKFYNESNNGTCAGVTSQILNLSSYGGKLTKGGKC